MRVRISKNVVLKLLELTQKQWFNQKSYDLLTLFCNEKSRVNIIP